MHDGCASRQLPCRHDDTCAWAVACIRTCMNDSCVPTATCCTVDTHNYHRLLRLPSLASSVVHVILSLYFCMDCYLFFPLYKYNKTWVARMPIVYININIPLISVFPPTRYMVVKIARFSFEVILWTIKHTVIYPDLDLSSKVISIRPLICI
jgi:hypothetical protein